VCQASLLVKGSVAIQYDLHRAAWIICSENPHPAKKGELFFFPPPHNPTQLRTARMVPNAPGIQAKHWCVCTAVNNPVAHADQQIAHALCALLGTGRVRVAHEILPRRALWKRRTQRLSSITGKIASLCRDTALNRAGMPRRRAERRHTAVMRKGPVLAPEVSRLKVGIRQR